jgi:hypothetical protein
MDKQVNTTKDMAIDTEPHLLFEDIDDLYDETGDINDKYRYMLQLNKNRGIEGNNNLPKKKSGESFPGTTK